MVSGKQNGKLKQKRCNGIRRGEKVINGYAKKNLVLKNRYGLKKMSYSYGTVLETGMIAIRYYQN
jgi:hypothetical protein